MVTFPRTRWSTTKFFPVNSLMNLIKTWISTLLKFMEISLFLKEDALRFGKLAFWSGTTEVFSANAWVDIIRNIQKRNPKISFDPLKIDFIISPNFICLPSVFANRSRSAVPYLFEAYRRLGHSGLRVLQLWGHYWLFHIQLATSLFDMVSYRQYLALSLDLHRHIRGWL